ncbi:hypothetical protein [Enterococcus timonensis]|uniref:hypothetical protein n=1 Tax=Enterococcus timonensis TaxID=1852364 RepID=UPI001319F49D|nr:hypothetical protein [Enterococcus timonensis]
MSRPFSFSWYNGQKGVIILLEQLQVEDFKRVLEIFDSAKLKLKNDGVDQWQTGYPNIENLWADVKSGVGYVWQEEGLILGYGALIFGQEPSYQQIKGAWQTKETPYATIHRFCIITGVAPLTSDTFLQALSDLARQNQAQSVRIDTHDQNIRMQHLLERSHFQSCGEIILHDTGEARLAFEKLI